MRHGQGWETVPALIMEDDMETEYKFNQDKEEIKVIISKLNSEMYNLRAQANRIESIIYMLWTVEQNIKE